MTLERILLVEDDPEVLDITLCALEQEGYFLYTASTLRAARNVLSCEQPDLIVLDIRLPDGSGLDFCSELRKTTSIPLLFLTINDTTEDIVAGLRAGGDDYLTKPFSTEELCARVDALLRRTKLQQTNQFQTIGNDLVLDFLAQRAYFKEKDLLLRPKEFQLLAALAHEPGRFVENGRLFREIWKADVNEDVRTIMVHISRIRRKFSEEKIGTVRIECNPGQGYRLVVEEGSRT